MANSVVECISQHAGQNPGKLCLADAKQSLDYKTTWAHIQDCAQLLLSWGCCKGQYVLVECTQNVEYMIWMLAAHLAGAIAVPLEKNAAESRVAEIADETGAKVMTFYAMHNVSREDFEAGVTYVEMMERNVEVLLVAL